MSELKRKGERREGKVGNAGPGMKTEVERRWVRAMVEGNRVARRSEEWYKSSRRGIRPG
jgi:hypothetical protein